MSRAALLLCLLACALHCAVARRLFEGDATALCAASPIDQRVRVNRTAFAACYQQQVWEVRSCPPGLLFEERTQTCIPEEGVRLVPEPVPVANATGAPSIFLYVWAGNDNPGPDCRDAVGVLDGTPTSATFGKLLNVVYTPTWGNEPHHVGLSNNTFLAVGGIQAYLHSNPDIYIFNTTQPDAPTFLTSADPPLSAATDSFIAQADGGFFVSQMGNATGGTPGRIARLDGQFNVVKEFPDSPPPGFNPHGFAIDATRRRLVSVDYLELQATLNGPTINESFRGDGTFKYRSTLRVWSLPEFSLVGEFDSGEDNSNGFMTVQFVGSSGIAVSGNGRGMLWAINATNPSDVRPAHFIGDKASSCVMIPLAFSGGRRFFITSLGLSLIQLVDTSDPQRLRTIQEIYLPEGSYPHSITAARNGTLVAVSTYYLNQVYRSKGGSIGVLQQLGSRQVYFFDVLDNGDRIAFNSRVPVVDFKNDVNTFRGECDPNPRCGGWRPHGMVFKTVTNPVTGIPSRSVGCPTSG